VSYLPALYQSDEKALDSATKTQQQLRDRSASLRNLVSEQVERAKAAKAADAEARKELKAKAKEIAHLQDLNRQSG
jgi:hypothetical protein